MGEDFLFQEYGQYSWFTKNREGVYTGMCERSAASVGLQAYEPEMRVHDRDLPWSETGVHGIEEEDWQVLNRGSTVYVRHLVLGANNQWFQMAGVKAPLKDGGILGKLTITPASQLYHGWPAALCRDSMTLQLNDHAVLTRQEMILAHAFLHGIPRKVMATAAGVSVKAIEKRLAVLREKLRHPGCRCFSLHGCLDANNLTDFLLVQGDWFDPVGTYQRRISA